MFQNFQKNLIKLHKHMHFKVTKYKILIDHNHFLRNYQVLEIKTIIMLLIHSNSLLRMTELNDVLKNN